MPQQIGTVHLRHHQRNRRLHAKGAGIVDDHRAGPRRHRPKPPRRLGAHRDEGDINVIEGVISGFFHHKCLAVHVHLPAGGALGCQQLQVAMLRVTCLDEAQGYLADGAGGAHYGEVHSLKVHIAPVVCVRDVRTDFTPKSRRCAVCGVGAPRLNGRSMDAVIAAARESVGGTAISRTIQITPGAPYRPDCPFPFILNLPLLSLRGA